MDYLIIGIMKILNNDKLWGFIYPIVFGFCINYPLYLILVSTIISIHVFYLAYNDIDIDNPFFVLLGYGPLLLVCYYGLIQLYKKISDWILIKKGRKIPDNWDNEFKD